MNFSLNVVCEAQTLARFKALYLYAGGFLVSSVVLLSHGRVRTVNLHFGAELPRLPLSRNPAIACVAFDESTPPALLPKFGTVFDVPPQQQVTCASHVVGPRAVQTWHSIQLLNVIGTNVLFLNPASTHTPSQVNTQLGEFTLRRHTMETLPREIENHPDFQAVFGVAEDSAR